MPLLSYWYWEAGPFRGDLVVVIKKGFDWESMLLKKRGFLLELDLQHFQLHRYHRLCPKYRRDLGTDGKKGATQ